MPRPPALLELFCGTKSVGKEFARVGFSVLSVDFDPRFDADITADILKIPDDFFYDFDAVWASPPCNAFSVNVIGRNWQDKKPVTATARHGIAMLRKTIAIIREVNPKLFWIENPRGMMRTLPMMDQFDRRTVTYCQYGDTRMKPTDIWTSSTWQGRPPCNNGDYCHEAAGRGEKSGTSGLKDARERAIIPAPLCREIARHAVKELHTRRGSK